MKTLLKSINAFLMIFYVATVILILLLNWKKVTVAEEVSFGFGTITSSPFIIAITLSGIIIFLMGAINYVVSLKNEIEIRKKQNELNDCNARQVAKIERENGYHYQKISEELSGIQKQMQELNELKNHRF